MTLGPYNGTDIIRNPFLILLIVACIVTLTLLGEMALTAPPGHYWRGAIIPQTLGCLCCLLLWFVFDGSDVFVPIIFAVPTSGPVLAALWVWWEKKSEAAKAKALVDAAAEVVDKVADASEPTSTHFDSNLSTMQPEYHLKSEPEVIDRLTASSRLEGLVQTAQSPSTPVILLPRLSSTRTIDSDEGDLESGYVTPRDYRIRTYPPFLPIELRTLAAASCV
ncbi:hypothetical protein FOZ63_033108 [Perkinsus olseni]|uniref:Uncharacterized protein n=1 Tax=Perkinsus olseni TaxID=32597 RepID=A0A7J6R391_PEROL|nr:hypothetical protein FOZ63_033108 [Perkinsus olseni]